MQIKNHLAELVKQAILNAQNAGALATFAMPETFVERPQRKEYGDFSTSLPLKLAREAKRAPLQIAQAIAAHVPQDDAVAQVTATAPGFVNFVLSGTWLANQVETILTEGTHFGNAPAAKCERVQVEYVSANPTGPLTVGSARNAAYGDTLANLLVAAGHTVEREYYVNDAGSQIRHFGESVFARYAQALGKDEAFPEDGYKGTYITDMGKTFAEKFGDRFLQMPRADAIRELGRMGIDEVKTWLANTLARLDVRFNTWFSERSLYETDQFNNIMQTLREKNLVVEKEDAVWFAAQELGEDKDAVLIRSPKASPDPS